MAKQTGIRGRGIYLLPNLFTIAALFAGFYAIVAASKQNFEPAAIAILIAMVFDGLDGRIARLTHTQSEFGAQLDSLSDMVCFGLTPALVLYSWSLAYFGKPGWLAAFIYAACTALRLARFNSQSQGENKRYFQGLATPVAAGLMACIVWVCTMYEVDGRDLSFWIMIITVFVALLKVSTIRYRSFKDFDVRNRVPFMMIIVIVLILVLISFDPPDVLLAIFATYVLSGPVMTLWGLRGKRRSAKRKKTISKS